MKLAVTGIPASGKTTLAKKLAKLLGWRYINVTDFAKENKCVSGKDKARGSLIVDEKKVDALLKKIKEDCVVDGHFSHIFSSVNKCILARCSRDVLYKRMKARKYPAKKIEENMDAAIFEVIEDEIATRPKLPLLIVDTSKKVYVPSTKKMITWIK